MPGSVALQPCSAKYQAVSALWGKPSGAPCLCDRKKAAKGNSKTFKINTTFMEQTLQLDPCFCVCAQKAVQCTNLYFTHAIAQKSPSLYKSMSFLLHGNKYRLYSHTVKQVTLLRVSGIYTKAELQLSLKLLCYETADNTQPMGGGPSVSVLLHTIRVMTKEREQRDFGFHCWDCLVCLTRPFRSSRRIPRSLVSPVSKVASRKRKVKLTDQCNTLEGDTQKARRANGWKKRIDLPQLSAMLP